jgi:predicted enzyme related to lactoylglutathione lyase
MNFAGGAGLMGIRPPSDLIHLELHTSDRARATAFYALLCGWRPELVEAGHASYLTLDLGGGVGGGIVEREAPHALWLPYVEVEDVDTATERAQALGAKVVLGPREGPAGWRSVVSAPAVGEIAFWRSKAGVSARPGELARGAPARG